MDTSQKVAALRDELGLTQRELADKIKCDPVAVSRWERGVASPSLRNMRALAQLTGRPLSYFYEGTAA